MTFQRMRMTTPRSARVTRKLGRLLSGDFSGKHWFRVTDVLVEKKTWLFLDWPKTFLKWLFYSISNFNVNLNQFPKALDKGHSKILHICIYSGRSAWDGGKRRSWRSYGGRRRSVPSRSAKRGESSTQKSRITVKWSVLYSLTCLFTFIIFPFQWLVEMDEIRNNLCDSILGQQLSLRKKFSTSDHSTVSWPTERACSIAEVFHSLRLPMDHSYDIKLTEAMI